MEKKLLERNYIFRIRTLKWKIFLMTTQECYEVNEMTRDIFEILSTAMSIDNLMLELKKIYEDLDEKEVREFIKILLEKGVVREC